MKINCMGQTCLSEELTKTIEVIATTQDECMLQKLCDSINAETSSDSRVDAVRYAFHSFRNEVKLMARFLTDAMRTFDDGHVEYAVAECLMESTDTDCYEMLLRSGLHLKDIWSLWRYTQMLPQGKKLLFESIVLKKSVCNEICCRHFMTSKKYPNSYKIVISTIQAHNSESFPALLYLLREFPLEPHNRKSFQMVFRALVLAGYKPSKDFVAKVINKSYKQVVFGNFESFGRWYRQHSKGVPTLMHLCRTKLRNTCKRNVIYSVSKLDIPEHLQKYITLRDEESMNIIFKTEV